MAAAIHPDAPAFGSDRFARARHLVRDVEIAPECAARLLFVAGAVAWHLVVEGGRIVAWDAGGLDAPAVEVRWSDDVARRVVRGELRGNDALAATTVAAPAADGTYVGPPAPFDLSSRPELTTMPRVPRATLCVQYHYRRGPFGDVSEVIRFEDGRFVEQSAGETASADVHIEISFLGLARVRAGEITVIQSFEGGGVQGDLGGLAAFDGLVESPEFHAAELATGRHAIALAVLGELDADERFTAAMRALA